ncbi:MAG: hypothetical protein K2L48_04105 [Mycoplasmoidaceae bacterium]|nr:hypothetical protein [Mycoplasmoidaceae bacterium]
MYSLLFVAIAVVGLVMIFTVGVHNSYSFYGGTRIVIFVGNVTGFDFNGFIASLNQLHIAS